MKKQVRIGTETASKAPLIAPLSLPFNSISLFQFKRKFVFCVEIQYKKAVEIPLVKISIDIHTDADDAQTKR